MPDRFGEGRTELLRALEIAHQESGNYDAGVALNTLGVLDLAQGRTDEGREHFEQALKNFEKQDVPIYLINTAQTLNNLGLVDDEQSRLKEGRLHFQEALKIYRRLAQQSPDIYLAFVGLTLNNLGSLEHDDEQHREQCRLNYEEALRDFRQQAQQDPETYLSFVAIVLNNMGNLNKDEDRLAEARLQYEEALGILRKIAEQNGGAFPLIPLFPISQQYPASNQQALALLLNNLGNLDTVQNRNEDAREHLQEALKIRRDLARQTPEVYREDVGTTVGRPRWRSAPCLDRPARAGLLSRNPSKLARPGSSCVG